MGKYQLDYKGMQQVERFHEKHSTAKGNKKARVNEIESTIFGKSEEKK